MITYITLCKLTDQGIRAIKDVTARADLAREVGRKFGVDMREIYWTVGQYDMVTVCEAKDEESMMAFGMTISSAGNLRFESLRAFSKEEVSGFIAKMG